MDVILYIVLGLLLLYFVIRRNSGKHKPIPGPTGWPLVGYAPYIKIGEEYKLFTAIADKYGEIFKLNVFGKHITVLNSAQLIRKAFSGDEYKKFFNDRDESFVGKYVLFNHQSIAFNLKAYGPDYGKLRKAVYGDGKQIFEDNITSELIHLVKKVQLIQDNEFDMLALLRRSLSNVMSITAMVEAWQCISVWNQMNCHGHFCERKSKVEELGGHDLNDDDKDLNMFWDFDETTDYFLGHRVNSVMVSFPFLRFIPGTFKTEYEKNESAKQRILKRFFHEKKATYKPGVARGLVDFFIGEQLEAQREDRDALFTNERIMAILLEIVAAGIITSLSTIASLLLCLLNNPEYQAKIQAELDRVVGRERLPTITDKRDCVFTEAVILEVMRYLPAVPLFIPHFCEEGIDIEGYQIPPKSLVIANAWYIHHDEKVWGDPWKFRPERWLDDNGDLLPNDHILRQNWLPFGRGRRQCPGEGLARSRVFLYVATLLQKWIFEMSPENAVSCDPRHGNFDIALIIRPKPFFCKAVPRK